MTYVLNDGTYEMTTDADREDKLRRTIDERLGRDAETWFDQVLEDRDSAAREEACDEVGKEYATLKDLLDNILYRFDDYLKMPDIFRRDLKRLQTDLDGYATKYEKAG